MGLLDKLIEAPGLGGAVAGGHEARTLDVSGASDSQVLGTLVTTFGSDEECAEIRVLREEVSRLRAEVRARGSKLIAGSDAMRELMSRVLRVAQSELPVLVLGETGSGKELVARAIHDVSARRGPFVPMN